MIKFEIDESIEYRGGNHYCYVYANTPSEVVEALKDAWYSSGIHRHGGELFLSAYLKDSDGKEIALSIGNCSVDKKDNLYSSFEFPYDQVDQNKWNCLGLFSDNFKSNDFESVLDIIFDYDCPSRVLGGYLYKSELLWQKLPKTQKKSFGENILANILDFASAHNKLYPMYDWLISVEGKKFLSENYLFALAGSEVDDAIKKVGGKDLKEFVNSFKKDFGFKLFLPSLNL